MKPKVSELSQRYVLALRTQLKQGPQASLQPALALGRQAVALRLDTLDLARIHEQALATLGLFNVKNALTKLAGIFFAEANTLIEETHRAARQTQVQLGKLTTKLGQRTDELAVSNRQLRRGVVRCQDMEDDFAKRGRLQQKSLEESLELQKRLHQLTHRLIAAQEHERKSISHELQDEIGQTLLGINVRLLSLKQHIRSNTKDFRDEITSTQRLVLDSAKTVRQFARQLDVPQPAHSDPSAMNPPHDMATNSSRPATSGNRPKKSANAARKKFPVSPRNSSLRVIAMAASAGGLKALSVIVGGLPVDFPAAIAIVMHVSPNHKSLLAEILNRRSHLPVKEAHNGDILCPSTVFVAPPNHHLLVAKGGRLELSSPAAEKIHFARPSAEPLFASVARVYKKNAIAVVLTGGDGDGSFGVQIIKDHGGKVIAQDRPTSENFSMPETSIQTGDVDFILPLNEIASKLIELVGAGRGKENGRTNIQMATHTPVPANFLKPLYAAGTKDATIMR